MISNYEYDVIGAVNMANDYGIAQREFMWLVLLHRSTTDEHTKELIEERLTDINYHTICGYMHNGEYDKAIKDYFGNLRG